MYNNFTTSAELIAFFKILLLSKTFYITKNLLTTYVLQFNDNVHIYTLVILLILKFQYDKYNLL